MAEGALRQAAERRGLSLRIDSAGTASYHIGSPPDPRAIDVAHRHGVDISGQVARRLEATDFYEFTHIIALDRSNLEGVRARAPRLGEAQISMMLDAVEGREGQPVADPYYGTDADFENAWALISEAADAWAERLALEARQRR